MTNEETLKLALELLKSAHVSTDLVWKRHDCVQALEESLAKQECVYTNDTSKEHVDETHKNVHEQKQGEPVAWTADDMAYRPDGLPQEFIHHEVESPDDWSEWICPKPEQYFLKCCDCGLVHEAQFRVAKYGEGDYCELVEDKDTQAQFRMRRRTTPQQRTWVGLTEEDVDAAEIHLTSCRNNHESWIEGIQEFANVIEAKLKEKNGF